MTIASHPASSSAFALSAANGPHAAATGTPAFFTSRTIFACSSTEQLRCKTPRPPSEPSAIAIRASVTRSIAAERKGTESGIPAITVLSDASAGSISDAPGRMSTSSKVNPSLRILTAMRHYTPRGQKVNYFLKLLQRARSDLRRRKSFPHPKRCTRSGEDAVHHAIELSEPVEVAV